LKLLYEFYTKTRTLHLFGLYMSVVDLSPVARQNILFIRLSAIGDIVMASPLLAALRAVHPDARIAWLVQPESRDLLEFHPDVDELIVWPRQQWHQLLRERRWFALWREIRDFRRQLRNHHFDLAIDAQGLLKSGFLAWLSGAGDRIGLGSREGSQWLMTQVVDRGGDSRRIGSEYLHLAMQMGLSGESFEMQLALSEEDERYALGVSQTHGLQGGYLVICPFTTRPQKHWFDERWIELVPRLEERFGMAVIMLGGPGDREHAAAIEIQTSTGLINLTGATRLRQAAALIKYSAMLIGVDTGLTHMGIAFNRPTLCLFGATCPYLDTTHENAVVIYHKFDCSPCKRRPTCSGRFDCMAAISADEVVDQAALLLATDAPA
jgi:heptosyltransferase-1